MEPGEEEEAAEDDPGGEEVGGDADAASGGRIIASGNAVDSWASSELITLDHLSAFLPSSFQESDLSDAMELFAEHCRHLEPGAWRVKTLHLTRIIMDAEWPLEGEDHDYDSPSLRDDGLKHVMHLFEDGYSNDIRELRICIDHILVSRIFLERLMHCLSRLKDLRILHVYLRSHPWIPNETTFEEATVIFWRIFAEAMLSNTCLEELVADQHPRRHFPTTRFPAALWHLPSLRVLNLQLGLGADLVRSLDPAVQCNSGHWSLLKSIDLSNNGIGTKGGEFIAQALMSGHLGSLRELNLSCNFLGDGIAEALATSLQLGKVSHLEFLGLARNRLGKAGVKYLAEAFKSGALGSLRALDLASNFLREGFASLVISFQSDQATKLEFLGLGSNELEDRDITDFAEAMKFGKLPNLHSLNLNNMYCRGTEGLAALAEAFKSGKLKLVEKIDLSATLIGSLASDRHHECQAIVKDIAGILEQNKLPSLKCMRLPNISLSSVSEDTLDSAYRRNPNLTAEVTSGGPKYSPFAVELRQSNEKRRSMLKQLADEKDVEGKHSKLFFCGDPRVDKMTLRKTFCNMSSPADQERTRGIEVTNIPYYEVTIALWDLAGHRI